MVNYQNSKIYRLVCSETNQQYIGSTTRSLSQRKAGHKHHTNSTYSKTFINPQIFLIKNCPCNSKEELHAIERTYIESLDCINFRIPGRTPKEYQEANKEKIKEKAIEYYQANKEKIKEKGIEYRISNQEKLKIRKKNYYEKNKEKVLEKVKKYNAENKNK